MKLVTNKISLLLLLGIIATTNSHLKHPSGHDTKNLDGVNKARKLPGLGTDGGDDGANDDEEIEFYEKYIQDTITLNNGITVGKKMISHGGRDIVAFQGIRYVDRPYRFTVPGQVKASDSYDNPLMAVNIGSQCPQLSKWQINNISAVVGDEDCLFLNVYSPMTSLDQENPALPVMVFIHGGQFTHGDASSYMPTRLLDEDVVLVTFHYRLGALGFYTSGEPDNPGNLAIYDQNAALKWVNKYIVDFGGDKKKVTLFGQDAGAVSALYHLISDNSKDHNDEGERITLFHAVIAQSGSPLNPYAFDVNPQKSSEDIRKAVNCEGVTNTSKCMSSTTVENLVLAAQIIAEKRDVHIAYFAPGIELNTGIINDSPLNLSTKGNYKKLPLMLGTCAQEGSFVFGEFYSYYLTPDKYEDKDYIETQMVPELIHFAGFNDILEFVAFTLYETYLKDLDRRNFEEVIPGMIDMTGSLFYKSGALETAKLSYESGSKDGLLDNEETDIFLYSFEYKGTDSTFPSHFWGAEYKPDFSSDQIGVTHGDDLLYLLTMSSLTTNKDEEMMETMVKMWTTFATEYKPIVDDGKFGTDWLPYTNEKQEYLCIGEDLKAMEGYEKSYTLLVDDDDKGIIGGSNELADDPETLLDIIPGTDDDDKDDTKYENLKFCDCEELYDVLDEREAYMISMIIFILLFVLTMVLALYLKGTKSSDL